MNSKPSLRLKLDPLETFIQKKWKNKNSTYTYMFSISMVICRVPRPLTRNVSAVSPSSTFIAKLRSSSR